MSYPTPVGMQCFSLSADPYFPFQQGHFQQTLGGFTPTSFRFSRVPLLTPSLFRAILKISRVHRLSRPPYCF